MIEAKWIDFIEGELSDLEMAQVESVLKFSKHDRMAFEELLAFMALVKSADSYRVLAKTSDLESLESQIMAKVHAEAKIVKPVLTILNHNTRKTARRLIFRTVAKNRLYGSAQKFFLKRKRTALKEAKHFFSLGL